MSKIVDDVKSGLKGIRGAGDAIRGSAMEATDQAFDNNSNHPQTQLSQAKNRGIAEKGKQDIAGTDHMVARHEQKHGKQPAMGAAPTTTSTTAGTTAGTGVGGATTETGTTGVGATTTETGTMGVNSRVI
ncbi:hypothetical protein PG994_004863 [Apiospora phragmitis]|uniref:Uncharacterized protein n=1 Tax=Apiospora phragmitis TaxID=2905665 RepID=A0ABR1VRT4_9PEZI